MFRRIGGSLVVLGIGVTLAACGSTASPAHDTGSGTASLVARNAGPANPNTLAEPVYVEFDPTPAAQKPAELDIYNHTELTGITWSSWGGAKAQGSGVLHNNDCTPDCASGHDDTYAAKITLTDVQPVNAKHEYTRYTVTFQGQDKLPELASALTDQPTDPSH